MHAGFTLAPRFQLMERYSKNQKPDNRPWSQTGSESPAKIPRAFWHSKITRGSAQSTPRMSRCKPLEDELHHEASIERRLETGTQTAGIHITIANGGRLLEVQV